MKPKLNREAVDAIKNFLMSPDGFGCGGAEWEVFSNYLSSLVVKNELEEWVIERSPIGIPPFMSSLLNEYFSWLDKEQENEEAND